MSKNRIATLPQGEWIRTLASMFSNKEPGTAWYLSRKQATKQSFEQFREDSMRRLRAEIESLPPTTQLLVLSSEGLFTCRDKELRTLQGLLDEYCDRIEIITYLRRQDFMATSKLKNKVRNASRSEPINASYRRNMDYWFYLQNWAAVFGREHINVRRFPDSAPQKFDLLEHFQSELADRVDGWSGTFEIPEFRNVGWSWQASEYLRIANSVCNEPLSDRKFHRRLVREIDRQYTGGEKPSIHRQLAIEIVANYEQPNENIRKTYFPDESELFHGDFSRYPETERELNQKLTVEMAVQVGTNLMAGMQKERIDRRDRRHEMQRAGSLGGWISRGERFFNRVRKLCGI